MSEVITYMKFAREMANGWGRNDATLQTLVKQAPGDILDRSILCVLVAILDKLPQRVTELPADKEPSHGMLDGLMSLAPRLIRQLGDMDVSSVPGVSAYRVNQTLKRYATIDDALNADLTRHEEIGRTRAARIKEMLQQVKDRGAV